MPNLMCAQYVVNSIQDGRMQTITNVFLKSYSGLFFGFQAEEDVYFIKNRKGCTMTQVEEKTSG
jgi:hypothetical protein